MSRRATRPYSILLLLITLCPNVFGEIVNNPFKIDTVSFTFSALDKKPVLILPDGKAVKIPGEWLYPPKEVEKEQGAYVSSFNYREQVTSFLVDNERLGIHLSSWDQMPTGTGSAMAGAGRDIFLVYNRRTHHIQEGIIDLGVTKDRVRSMGCFFSTFHDFVLLDINNDGLTDIGVKREKIWCEEETDEKQHRDVISGPYYKEDPVKWYVLRGNKWEKLPQLNEAQPAKTIQKMPLIGLTKSPVDFVREMYKNKLKVRE